MSQTGNVPDRGMLIARLTSSRQWERLLEAAQDWLSTEPENAAAHRCAAQALINLGRHGQAEPHLVKLLAARPNDDFAHRLMSIAYFKFKRFGEADESIRRAIAINPNDPNHWYHLAWMCYTQKDLVSGMKWITKARELAPTNPDILNLYALCLPSGADQSGGRAEVLREVLALDPENANAHNNLGTYYLNVAKNYREAEACFRRALAIDPSLGASRRNLFVAIKQRDWIYRALCAPRDFILHIWSAFARRDRRNVVVFVLGAFVWLFAFRFLFAGLALWFAFFWPLVKVYEFMVVGDIRSQAGEIGARHGGFLGYRRWPLKLRLSLFGGLLFGFWFGIYYFGYVQSLASGKFADGKAALAALVVLLVVMLALLVFLVRRIWKGAALRYHSWRRQRRLKHLSPIENESP